MHYNCLPVVDVSRLFVPVCDNLCLPLQITKADIFSLLLGLMQLLSNVAKLNYGDKNEIKKLQD